MVLPDVVCPLLRLEFRPFQRQHQARYTPRGTILRPSRQHPPAGTGARSVAAPPPGHSRGQWHWRRPPARANSRVAHVLEADNAPQSHPGRLATEPASPCWHPLVTAGQSHPTHLRYSRVVCRDVDACQLAHSVGVTMTATAAASSAQLCRRQRLSHTLHRRQQLLQLGGLDSAPAVASKRTIKREVLLSMASWVGQIFAPCTR